MSRQTSTIQVEQEVQVAEDYCDVTSERVLRAEDGRPVACPVNHVEVRPMILTEEADGTVRRLAPTTDAPLIRIALADFVKLVGAERLGELFRQFEFTEAGEIRRK